MQVKNVFRKSALALMLLCGAAQAQNFEFNLAVIPAPTDKS